MKKHRGLFKKNDPRTAKGGKRNPSGGRPTKETQEIKRQAAQIAQEFIDKNIKPIMETYVGLAAGKTIKRNNKKFKLLVDPSTTRDAVAKLLPAARQEIQFTGDFKVGVRQEVINRILGRGKNDFRS